MKRSEALRQAIEFLKVRTLPDAQMQDIPRLHEMWQELHLMAQDELRKEQAAEAEKLPAVPVPSPSA